MVQLEHTKGTSLVQAARQEGMVFGRLQHIAVLVVAQLAASLADAQGAPTLLVKGVSSLELRRGITNSRTSKDLDTIAREDIEQVHERLADAGEASFEGFGAVFTAPEEIEVPGLRVKPTVRCQTEGFLGGGCSVLTN